MPRSTQKVRATTGWLILATTAMTGLTGCQFNEGGQTLPSPYYLYDDVQFFPAGPEFKLSREAAALEAAEARAKTGDQPQP
jgi:hypothetical protein